MEDFQIIKPPAGRFYADPFVIEKDGKNYIFFEDYKITKGKGVISFIEIGDAGVCTEPKVVLEKKHHLAYPFLFHYEHKIYMIPDTGHNNTIELYEAVNFPDEWRLIKVLMAGFKAVDSTLLFHNDKVWLFANVFEAGDDYGKLCVFYADSIFSEWKPHRKNPVNADQHSARPAGHIFRHEGKLIRPSQKWGTLYGQAMVFNEIIDLSEDNYQEVQLMEVGPEWLDKNECFHTYNFNEQFEVIDGLVIKNEILKLPRWLVAHI